MADANRTRLDKLDNIAADVCRAKAVLQMLVHIFGGDADTDKPSETPGLGYSIQHAARMLCEIRDKLTALGGDTNDAAVIAMEAAALAEMIDHLIFNNDHKIRMSDCWLCSYFDAINNCMECVNVKLSKAMEPALKAA